MFDKEKVCMSDDARLLRIASTNRFWSTLFQAMLFCAILLSIDAASSVDFLIDNADRIEFQSLLCGHGTGAARVGCKLLPPLVAMDSKYLRCRNRLLLIGGFVEYDSGMNNVVQEFVGDGRDGRWHTLMLLPDGAPETHQAAMCGDESTNILFYIVGGQIDHSYGRASTGRRLQ
jgi:hypothetical protein